MILEENVCVNNLGEKSLIIVLLCMLHEIQPLFGRQRLEQDRSSRLVSLWLMLAEREFDFVALSLYITSMMPSSDY